MKKYTQTEIRKNSPLNIIACPLSLSEMQDAEGGKYCHLCKHTLRDFTRSTPEEIDEAFANGAYCGIFNFEQASQWSPAHSVFRGMMHHPYRAVTASLFALSIFLAQKTVAQQAEPALETQIYSNSITACAVRMEGRPLRGVTVRAESSAGQTEAKTDSEGMASLTWSPGVDSESPTIKIYYKGLLVKTEKFDEGRADFCPVIEVSRSEVEKAALVSKVRKKARHHRPKFGKRKDYRFGGVYHR